MPTETIQPAFLFVLDLMFVKLQDNKAGSPLSCAYDSA